VPALAHFFLVRVSAFEPDLSGIGESEANVTWRWWTLDDLQKTPELVIPPRFTELFAALAAGVLPASPVDAS
jgi:hypothetical protein